MRTSYASRGPTKDEESFLRRALASPTQSSHSTPLPESLHTPSPWVGCLAWTGAPVPLRFGWCWWTGDISGEEDTLACTTSIVTIVPAR